MKRIQVDGRRYQLPAGEAELERTIRRALVAEARFREAKAAMDESKAELVEIATARRNAETTITLSGISGDALVTFRETLEPDPDSDRLRPALGALWDRFFESRRTIKAKKPLKQFMEGADMGMDPAEAAAMRDRIAGHIAAKAIRPNVKLSAKA